MFFSIIYCYQQNTYSWNLLIHIITTLGVTVRMRKEFFRWLRCVPIVRRKIEEKMSEINAGFKRDIKNKLAGVTIRPVLPEKGLSAEQINQEVKDHLALGNQYNIFILNSKNK